MPEPQSYLVAFITLGMVCDAFIIVLSEERLLTSALRAPDGSSDILLKQERDKPFGPLHICLILPAKIVETFGLVFLCHKKQKQRRE